MPRAAGLTWRHAVTLLLLAVALPTFTLAAVACLPVLLLAVGGHSLRQLWALSPQPRRTAAQPAH